MASKQCGNGGVHDHADSLGKQCAEHRHTDRVKVGWEVVTVDGASCSGRPITPLCVVPEKADANYMINRNAWEIHHE